MGTSGKHRFDTLIKTMIARIEYNNTLAPVQEYGRHQMHAKKKKKGTKVAGDENQKVMEDSEEEKQPAKATGPGGKGAANYFDDRYYDLDDNFIDDGDLDDSCYNNGLYNMGSGGGGFGDEFEGLHDLEDDDMQSGFHPNQFSGSKSKNSLSVRYDADADQ